MCVGQAAATTTLPYKVLPAYQAQLQDLRQVVQRALSAAPYKVMLHHSKGTISFGCLSRT